MSKILITGGAGYVGAVLTPYLLNKGHKITVIDLMIYGEEVLSKNPNLRVIKGDIRDTNLLEKELPNHEVVIHLACISNDPSFELNPKLGRSINLDAFTPLVEIAKKNLVKRTFFSLMLPQHNRIATRSLYNTVNKIWYLAGDHSTNFNYYTKRAILASVYSSTVFYWMNENKTLEQTKDFLNDHLKKVSKIPKIKERVDSIVNMFPQIFSFAKTFSRFKR